jgi:hypothetical protein
LHQQLDSLKQKHQSQSLAKQLLCFKAVDAYFRKKICSGFIFHGKARQLLVAGG